MSALHDKFCPWLIKLFLLNGLECMGHHSYSTAPQWAVCSIPMQSHLHEDDSSYLLKIPTILGSGTKFAMQNNLFMHKMWMKSL